MIRNLTALALVLAAVSAIGAVSASAASASVGTLTSTGPFYLLGTDEPTGNHFTYPGEESTTCPESHYTAEKVGTNEPIANDSSTITVTPVYTNCLSGGSLPTTITMNGCDYVYHIGETVGPGSTYNLTMDIECSGLNKIDIEVYSGAAEGLKLCTTTIGTQTGLVGGRITETGTNTLLVSGSIGGVSASKSGLCGSGSTTSAAYDLNITLHGFKSNEIEETTVAISHT